VLPAPQCPVVASAVSPAVPQAALFMTPPDLSLKHEEAQPAARRPIRSSRNQTHKYLDAEQRAMLKRGSIVSMKGRSRHKLRVSGEDALCQEKRAEWVTKAVDKCTRAASSGQLEPLQKIQSRGAHREAGFMPTSGIRFSWLLHVFG
jgi:hypothetical protein